MVIFQESESIRSTKMLKIFEMLPSISDIFKLLQINLGKVLSILFEKFCCNLLYFLFKGSSYGKIAFWGLGIGDWGLGLGIGPNPHLHLLPPIPNPHQ